LVRLSERAVAGELEVVERTPCGPPDVPSGIGSTLTTVGTRAATRRSDLTNRRDAARRRRPASTKLVDVEDVDHLGEPVS